MDDEIKKSKIYSPQEALKKILKYCAYQERSQQEVRDKLYDLGLHKKDVELTISKLIEEGFVNEERFAIAFAGGKFRIKQWGKVKIKYALKQKHISDYCIQKALKQINDHDYFKALNTVIASTAKKIKEKEVRKKKYKIAQFAISKGFEADLVWEVLNDKGD
jgi:regulatory protein